MVSGLVLRVTSGRVLVFTGVSTDLVLCNDDAVFVSVTLGTAWTVTGLLDLTIERGAVALRTFKLVVG